MRALAATPLVWLVVAPLAYGEPARIDVPKAVAEALDATKVRERDTVPGIGGKPAAGVVIAPPDHPDKAAVVAPPDPNDPMALELGTNQLRSRTPRHAWLPRDLSRAFKVAADKVWAFVLPKL